MANHRRVQVRASKFGRCSQICNVDGAFKPNFWQLNFIPAEACQIIESPGAQLRPIRVWFGGSETTTGSLLCVAMILIPDGVGHQLLTCSYCNSAHGWFGNMLQHWNGHLFR
jgi:hypothetical protein